MLFGAGVLLIWLVTRRRKRKKMSRFSDKETPEKATMTGYQAMPGDRLSHNSGQPQSKKLVATVRLWEPSQILGQ
jgi:hypothetical protein